jgi:cytochrome c553
MKNLVVLLALALLPCAAIAADTPDWAYGVAPQGLPRPDANKIITVPGSDKQYNEVTVSDRFGPADWFPNEHAPMPPIVAQGAKPDVWACALCHLPTGDGHPESAGLSGLPAAYIERQMEDFGKGNRKGTRATAMINFAKAISRDDVHADAQYYAARKVTPGYTKVVEQAEVPKSYVGEGAMRFVTANGGNEAIGERIIELPQDETGARARNPHVGFVAYVPPGSIAKGKALATTGGGGKTIACAVCHGEGLKGLGEVPPLAGRSAIYLVRQLMDIKSGARTGGMTLLMKQVVDKLDDGDIIALSAYAASQQP